MLNKQVELKEHFVCGLEYDLTPPRTMNDTTVLNPNCSDTLSSLNDVSSLLLADVVINVLIVILTTTANTCLIGIEINIWKTRKRISQPKMLILLLAGTDILSSVLGILPKVFIFTQIIHCLSSKTIFVYKFVRFCSQWFFFLSKLMVVLMGIERCIAIRTPFFYIRNCTLKAFCLTELGLVVYALIFATLSVYFEYMVFEEVMTHERFGHLGCHELFLTFEYSLLNQPSRFQKQEMFHTNWFTVVHIVHELLLFSILFVCNTGVICGLRDMQKRVHVSSVPSSMSIERDNKEPDMMLLTGREFSRLMLAVIIVFIILITPAVARELFNQIGVLPSYVSDFVCNHIALTSTFTNPFLYGLLRRKIRHRIAFRLTSCCRGCLPDQLVPLVTSSHISDSRRFSNGERGVGHRSTDVTCHIGSGIDLSARNGVN